MPIGWKIGQIVGFRPQMPVLPGRGRTLPWHPVPWKTIAPWELLIVGRCQANDGESIVEISTLFLETLGHGQPHMQELRPRDRRRAYCSSCAAGIMAIDTALTITFPPPLAIAVFHAFCRCSWVHFDRPSGASIHRCSPATYSVPSQARTLPPRSDPVSVSKSICCLSKDLGKFPFWVLTHVKTAGAKLRPWVQVVPTNGFRKRAVFVRSVGQIGSFRGRWGH